LSEAFAGLLGGLLATISLRTPYIAQAIASAVATSTVFTLTEPNSDQNPLIKVVKDIYNVIRYTLLDHSKLRNFILFSSLIGAATLCFVWFIQPYLIEIKMPLPIFGIVWTILNLTIGFTSFFSHRIESLLNEEQTTGFIYISIATVFILTGFCYSYYMLILVFAIYIIRGIATPLLKDYIYSLINSDLRTTIFSLRDMLKAGFFSAGMFILI